MNKTEVERVATRRKIEDKINYKERGGVKNKNKRESKGVR